MKIRMGKLTDAFLASYTKDGYKSFFTEEALKMKHIILVKGASAKIRTEMYKSVAHILAREGQDVELIHQAQNQALLEGLIVKKRQIIIADYGEEKRTKNAEIFDLTEYLDQEIYDIYAAKIVDLEEEIRVNLELLSESCKMINANHLPEAEIDEKAQQRLVKKIAAEYFFRDKPKPAVRFVRGLDGESLAECLREILADITRKYYLPPKMPDKTAALEELAEQAGAAGYEAIIYYDSWDGERAEVLSVPVLNLAISAQKMTDFAPCLKEMAEEWPNPRSIKKMLSSINVLQETLEEIYKDIMSEDYLAKAKESLRQKLDDCLENGAE